MSIWLVALDFGCRGRSRHQAQVAKIGGDDPSRRLRRCRLLRCKTIKRRVTQGTFAERPPRSLRLDVGKLDDSRHLSVSLAINLPNSAGLIGIGMPPKSSSRAFSADQQGPHLSPR